MQVLTAPTSFGHSDCERIVGAALAQPVLAVTSLAYVAAGMAVLCWAMRLRAPLAGAAGVALVAVGAGSFAYHGPQPSWAESAQRLADRRRGSGLRRRPASERAPAVAVGLGGSGRGLRAGTGRLRRRTLRVVAMSTRQPLAVPRSLARTLCRCRRMGRPCHGAGPARERQPSVNSATPFGGRATYASEPGGRTLLTCAGSRGGVGCLSIVLSVAARTGPGQRNRRTLRLSANCTPWEATACGQTRTT